MADTKSQSYPTLKVPTVSETRTVARLRALQEQLSHKPKGNKLAGKVCIITGVGSKRGIGRAAAFAYAHEGAAHLYLLDFVGENLPELEASLRNEYPETKVTVVQGDAADDATISGLCKRAIEEEGRLDVFFANAGVASAKLLHDTTAKEFMDQMRVNTLSCFLAVKYASEAMKRTSSEKPVGRGSIILTASVAGLRAGAGPPAYSASKAAVNSLAQTTPYILTGTDVRVNSICPGLIETGMTTQVFDSARKRGKGDKIGQLVPLQRYGLPEEIAQTAVFLASDDSSFVNGQNIAVDGGLSASHPYIIGRVA
ncbi:hypothetical protein FRB99_008031 [Tulasnella sp. 403]|nr:hypothetical protein FRB99_008031 [Tulasnella sp. 403]